MILTQGPIIFLRNLTPSIHNGSGMIKINMNKIESYIEIERGEYSKVKIIIGKNQYIVGCSEKDFEDKYFEFLNNK